MNDPISARYVWDAEAMTEALAAHLRQTLRPVFRYLLILLMLIYLFGTIGLPLLIIGGPGSSPDSRRNAIVALFIFVPLWAGLILAIRRRWLLRLHAWRVFRSTGRESQAAEWSIGPDELTSRTDLSASIILWPYFIKVVETPKGFMLYQNVQLFHWIPGHAFVSAAELRRFADLARSRVANYVVAGECLFPIKPEPTGRDEF